MPSLVAIVAAPGPRFVQGLLDAWDRGHAVLPVDPRLSRPARQRLLAAMRPGEIIDGDDRLRLADADPVEPRDALVVPTSGTTGAPKGVVLTHAALLAAALATSTRIGVDPARDRWLACLPLAHVGGLAVVTRALATGTRVECVDRFESSRTPATLVSLVPTLLERHDVTAFRVVLVGGAADWRERPSNVIHTYGATETGGGVVYDGAPLDGVELRIDESGQVLVRGPMLLRSYRDGSDPKDAAGWLPTGDAGELTPAGHLEVSGRMTEVIVTGGEKVWPGPVESILRRHPLVADVGVVGRPDPEWGQRVVAMVVPTRKAHPPTLDDLRGWTKDALPAWCAPAELIIVTALPRTGSGKLRRTKLVR